MPIACLVMSSADNSFTQSLTNTLVEKFEKDGYETHIAYSEGDLNLQLNQIQNYVVMNPAVIVIDCLGDSIVYDGIFARAKESGICLITMNGETVSSYADIQVLGNDLYKGIVAKKMISYYINQNFQNAEEKSINVLLMGMTNTESNVNSFAMYQLMAEKYIRKYDRANLQYIHEQNEETVYYLDGYHQFQQVEELTGGLILDENGYAILNPYYDSRINLILASNLNVISKLDGQNAIDTIYNQNQKEDIQIVVAMSGDAAIGAAEHLKFLYEDKNTYYNLSQLAVFGADDTKLNRELVMQSYNNQSLLRGFVCDYSVPLIVEHITHALNTVTDGKQSVYYNNSSFSRLTEDGKILGIITLVNDNSIEKWNILN